MIPLRCDHFLTYIGAVSLDDHLACYSQAGFIRLGRTVKHDPGLRTGGISFGPDYIELCWVEDEQLFAADEGDQDLFGKERHIVRAAQRPCGIGLITDNVAALREEWIARGYHLPPISSRRPRDAESGAQARWSILRIPDALTPGVKCFALTYHQLNQELRRVRIAPNGTYAVSGVTFVSHVPEEHARCWQQLLVPGAALASEHGRCSVRIGAHLMQWITPARYQEDFGIAWQQAPHSFGALAALHLFTEDLGRTYQMLKGTIWKTTWRMGVSSGQPSLLLLPNAIDGYLFAITAHSCADWFRERAALTGEMLVGGAGEDAAEARL